MKLLRRLLLVLVVLVLLAAGAGWIFLDRLVAAGIEKGSTYATGVDTEVGGVDASFFSGRFGLDGLTLANPPGFRPEPFLSMKTARASWDTGTILSDRIEMDELVLDGVDVNLERGSGGTNYGKILDHLEGLSKPGQEPETPAEGGKQLTIKRIEVRNVRAALHLSDVPLVGGSQSMAVTVPSIVIEDFRSDGSTTEVVAKLTKALLQAILESVMKMGADVFPKDVLKDLGAGLGDLGGAVEDAAKKTLEGLEGALKDAGGIFDRKK